jgi:plasmid stability protein
MGKPTNQKRPRGRPPQPEGVRRRSNLTLRVRDETKAALERNAAANGRSLSEEAETLLDQALRSPQLLDQAFDLALGQAPAGLVLLIVRAMQIVGSEAGIVATGHFVADGWLAAPYVFGQVVAALEAIIEAPRPEGDASPPNAPLGAGRDWNRRVATLGRATAQRLLADVVGTDGGAMSQWHAGIRERLGPQIVERIKQNLAGREGSQNG